MLWQYVFRIGHLPEPCDVVMLLAMVSTARVIVK